METPIAMFRVPLLDGRFYTAEVENDERSISEVEDPYVMVRFVLGPNASNFIYPHHYRREVERIIREQLDNLLKGTGCRPTGSCIYARADGNELKFCFRTHPDVIRLPDLTNKK